MPCESGRRSRDQRPTVKQRFLDVSSNLGKFSKKSQREITAGTTNSVSSRPLDFEGEFQIPGGSGGPFTPEHNIVVC